MNGNSISSNQHPNKITCFLIGESGLLIECAALLLDFDFEIKGILSLNYTIHQWALEKNIKIYTDRKEFWDILKSIKYDYLFSIVNPRIIPNTVLSTPSSLAINFHDSYLPYYRGVNSTSWAILNNAKFHGATWHVINSKIDGGGILGQEKIKIDQDDTAFSLDIKCHAKAVSILKDLVPKLLKKNYTIVNNPFKEGGYYSLKEKPFECGVLIWDKKSQLLYKEWRALNVAPLSYENKFCSPKLLIDDTFIIPYEFKISNDISTHSPGTIVDICKLDIKISTQDMDVSLSGFVDVYGNVLSISQVIKKHNLKLGMKLFIPNNQDLAKASKKFIDFSHEESKVFKNILNSKPCDFYVSDDSNQKISVTKRFFPEFLKKIDFISSHCGFDKKTIFNSILLIYFYRLNNYENFSLCISTKNILHNDLENKLFRNFVPSSFNLSPADKFDDVLKLVEKKKNEILNSKGYICDIFQRYPELSEKKNLINIIINNNELQNSISDECELYFNYVPGDAFYTYKTTQDNSGYFCSFAKYINEHLINLSADIIESGYQKRLRDMSYLSRFEMDVYYQLSKKEHFCHHESIFNLFKKQVALTPNNIALCSKNHKLTYTELMKASERLSLILANIANGKDVIIILMSEKIDAIILILATLCIGKAYLPIDENAPAKFLWSIVEDIDSAIIISQKSLFNKFYNSKNRKGDFFCYEDILKKNIVHTPSHINPVSTNGDSLAYIMFTSGSTGKQKGVKICHKAIIRLVKNNGFLDVNSNDIIAGGSNLAFDASTFEVWGALLNGAALHLISPEEILNFSIFKRVIIENKVTIMWLTSELFNHICDNDVMIFSYLKSLLVGGDIVSSKNVRKVYTECRNNILEIINGYGPTENTTFTTTYSIPRNINGRHPLPIGKPISKTKILILDKFRNLMPFNVKGELFIGGEGLFLGYINDPDLRNSSINKISLGGIENFYYKSGDYVMMSEENHLLYFIARKDNVKKVRGFRVNLSEIETQINKIDYIEQVNVLIHKENNSKQIIAFIKTKNRKKLDRKAFQDQLAENLPKYAMPTRIIELEDTPLTFSGKLDKRKLLGQEYTSSDKKHDKNSTLENKLITIASNLLGVSCLRKDDNFFDLGGHSLLVARLINEVKNKFNYELNLWAFMKLPTVTNVAQLIKENINMNHDLSPMIVRDMKLNDSFCTYKPNTSMEEPKAVFLTGATGFLGINLLNELLEKTSYKIYCLVRASSKSNAEKRIKESLNKYKIKVNGMLLKERIEIIVGDFELPYFGMKKNYFYEICNAINIILHNGARVHHLYDYELLRNANVLSTLELLKMMRSGKKKHYYFISTLSAANENRDKNNFINENYFKTEPMNFEFADGYTLSKMVSENILATARIQGNNVSIIRPGWILGRLDTGNCNLDTNHLSLFIKGCIQMQAIPNINARLNIMPVDVLSSVIVKIIQSRYDAPNVYNIINPYCCTWSDICRYIVSNDFYVESMSYNKWLKDYLNKTDQDNALFLLRPLYNAIDMSIFEKQDKLYDANYNNTKKIYEMLSIGNVDMSEHILEAYFQYMKNSGFLATTKEFIDGYS